MAVLLRMVKKTPQTEQVTECPPIVVIMGHIDHGKSTLLDYIRKSNVVATEAGGITQHISAYEVTQKGKRITFLDTPGHAAFQGMRSRGARVADIAVLVVSAEDGVKAQTLEALRAIKEAKIPYIVAINKIDKPNANIERTKQTLAEAEIYVEGYGGDIPWVGISAKLGQGVPELLDVILLVAEMGELTCTLDSNAKGVVIESNMDPKRGVTATLVITDGTLKKGMTIVAEDVMTPVRNIESFLGKSVDEAVCASPVRITGWTAIPSVGAQFIAFDSKKEAEEALLTTKHVVRQTPLDPSQSVDSVVVPVILRADVAGTLEAIGHEIAKIKHERVLLKVVQSGVGTVSENDVKSALGTLKETPIILAFHTKVDALAQDLASRNNVTIQSFDIIYKLTEWLSEEVGRRAPHIEVDEKLGELRIIRLFSQQKELQVIGGAVISGKITNGARFKIMRRDTEIGEGKIVELQSQKIKVQEVIEGNECGLQVESKFTLAERDVIVPFVTVKKQ